MVAQNNVPETSAQNSTWILGTGASHHMTFNIASLNNVTPFEGAETIKFRNGQGLSIHNIGSTMIKTPFSSLILNQVLHVPSIAVNLLSVTQLCKDNKCWFICDDIVFFVQDKEQSKSYTKEGLSLENCFISLPQHSHLQQHLLDNW
ncbi:hypothetical protein C1H46_032045 [Malus baccata]|uniref:Retrovirus-related Pol polyprotein from transposon TNT 1-94-like beta-barrel domain-containing protein n=1 Tax=Malus baccata TaxID=106549 RepID=A0A540L7E4_MALBA|nr:hypothetical protein C1H46_032045 [Malus baccata]